MVIILTSLKRQHHARGMSRQLHNHSSHFLMFSCIVQFSCSMLPVSSNCLTHIQIVFASETALLRGIWNLRRKALSVAITEFLFSKCAHRSNPMFSCQWGQRSITTRPKNTYPHLSPRTTPYKLLSPFCHTLYYPLHCRFL